MQAWREKVQSQTELPAGYTWGPDGKPVKAAAPVAEDPYLESLAIQVAEKLNPQAPVDTWVQDFQKADPNRYHQFKNKTPQKKEQMASAAHYAANEPSKKK